MTPTPAQIEAVLAEFEDELTSSQRKLITAEICRLTAAAEVKAPMFDQRTPDGPFELASGEAMPAAAEVGEPNHTHKLLGEMIEEVKRLSNEKEAATIERCCEIVAANEEDWHTSLAAIRALKDKP